MTDASDSAMDCPEEATLVGVALVLSISCIWGVALLGVEAPESDGEGGSRSIDCGRPRLFFRQPDLTSFTFGVIFAGSFVGDTSHSAIGLGWASDPSPITAISPASGEVGFCGDFGDSLDQNAHVEPALGGGSC